MSRYKAGDKFIIEIDSSMTNKKGQLYGVKGFKSLVFDDYGLDQLEEYGETNERIKGYEEGLADAWEAARKILCITSHGGICAEDISTIFGTSYMSTIMDTNTPQEAIAKIKEWGDGKIKRGDEMVHVMDSNAKMIVTYIAVDDDFIHGINRTGDLYSCTDPVNWRKTGRNFADKLDALLGEIGGDTNE